MLDLLSRPRSDVSPRRRRRRFAGMFFRSAAVVALVAGSLSVALVAAPPSHSLAIAPLVPPVIEGATEAVGAEVITGALVSNPVGWTIIGVAAVGVGLYATKDYWMPWVAGQFGSGNTSQPSGTPTGGQVHVIPGYSLTLATAPNAYTTRVTGTWNGGTGGFLNGHYAWIQQCQMPAGSHIADSTGNLWTISSVTNLRNIASPMNQNFDFACQGSNAYGTWYGTPIALKVGLAGTDGLPSLPADGSVAPGGPGNEVMTGSFKSGQFSPTDPTTKYTVTVECINSAGQKSQIMRDTYGDKGAVQFPSCAAAGLGHGDGVISITGSNPAAPAPVDLWDTTAPAANPAEPLCSPQLPSDGCAYSISIDNKPCVVGDVQCENWPEIAKTDTSTPPRVSCNHGPYLSVLAACNILEKAYFPGGAPATVPNTDGDPGTSGYTDPNGTPIPQPQPGPVTTGTIPGGAGQPGPAAVPAPGQDPLANPNYGDCFPSGWAVFNPVEWVLKPLGCAFIPKTDITTKLGTIQGDFAGRAPFTWFTGAGVLVAGGAGVHGSCPNWVINVGPVHQNVVCNSTFTSAIVASRGSIFGLMVIAMFWPLIRSLWYSVIPILRPSPATQ